MMKSAKPLILSSISLFVLLCALNAGKGPDDENQILINGRIWDKKYPGISGDPFLFTNQFLAGSVTIGSSNFTQLKIRYDIYTDEIMIPNDSVILQLNKERIDSFTLFWENRIRHFRKIPENSTYPFSGYVENIYSDKSKLYIKYRKKIDQPGIINVPDNFYMIRHIYFVTDGKVYTIKNRGNLMKILKNEKTRIRAYIRENKIHISKNDPATFVPILRFHDKIQTGS